MSTFVRKEKLKPLLFFMIKGFKCAYIYLTSGHKRSLDVISLIRKYDDSRLKINKRCVFNEKKKKKKK